MVVLKRMVQKVEGKMKMKERDRSKDWRKIKKEIWELKKREYRNEKKQNIWKEDRKKKRKLGVVLLYALSTNGRELGGKPAN